MGTVITTTIMITLLLISSLIVLTATEAHPQYQYSREIRDSPGQVEISLYQYYVQKYGRPSSIIHPSAVSTIPHYPPNPADIVLPEEDNPYDPYDQDDDPLCRDVYIPEYCN